MISEGLIIKCLFVVSVLLCIHYRNKLAKFTRETTEEHNRRTTYSLKCDNVSRKFGLEPGLTSSFDKVAVVEAVLSGEDNKTIEEMVVLNSKGLVLFHHEFKDECVFKFKEEVREAICDKTVLGYNVKELVEALEANEIVDHIHDNCILSPIDLCFFFAMVRGEKYFGEYFREREEYSLSACAEFYDCAIDDIDTSIVSRGKTVLKCFQRMSGNDKPVSGLVYE